MSDGDELNPASDDPEQDPAANVTEGGSLVYRHERRTVPFDLAVGDSDSIEQIIYHIEQHIGTIETVWHELISDLVHVDIHVVLPTDERPWITLITSGMSDAPMNVPEGAEDFRHAELLMVLPPEWPMEQEAFRDESHYWPLRQLKILARLPHEYDTWLGHGHTIPNGDPAEPYADNTRFTGALIVVPVTTPQEFWTLEVSPEKTTNFYAVVPLYPEEMEHKLQKGTDSLLELFDKYQINESIDLNRRNVARRGWFRR